MRSALAWIALALLVLSGLWILDRSTSSRAARSTARPATAPDASPVARARAAPVAEAPEPRRSSAASSDAEPEAPARDEFPRSRVSGRVEHADGTPAEGVVVEVRSANQRSAARPLARPRADEDGEFDVQVLGSGPFRLRAHASSGEVTRVEAAVEPVTAESCPVVVRFPRTTSARGRVLDERGEPVREFTLEVRCDDETAAFRQSFVAEDGAFRTDAFVADRWWVSAFAEGYAAAEPRLSYGGAELIVFRLARACRLSGVVLDRDGRPRAGARVEPSSARAPAFTDADGRFVVECGAGDVRLLARDASSADADPLELVLAPGEERAGLVLRLGPSGEITGQVTGLGGRPAMGREVSIHAVPADAERESPPACATDALGRFRVEVPPGPWKVSAALTPEELEVLELAAETENRAVEAISSEEVDVDDGAVAEVWLALAPAPVRVSGTLTKAGEPATGGEVVAADMESELRYRARVEGRSYALGLARPGLHRLAVSFGETTQLLWVDVPAVGAHTLDLDVPVGWIEGFVRTWTGQRAADVEVRALGAGGRGHAVTAADGTFTLELAPGAYEVAAGDDSWRHRDVEVVAGRRWTGLELVLRSDPAAPALTVLVRGPRGEWVDGARVTLAGGAFPEHAPAPATTRQGVAEFGRPGHGEYEVSIEAPGYFLPASARVEIAWNRPKRLELSLEPAFEVAVHVGASDGSTPVRDVDAVDVRSLVFAAERSEAAGSSAAPSEPEERGRTSFRFPGLPPGEYRLRLFAGEDVLERALRVDASASGPRVVDLSVP